jgi:hypothetical protein
MIRHSILKGITLSCMIALTAACGVKSRTTDVNPSVERAPTCPAAIASYASRAEVPYDYYELAWVEAEGNSVWTSDNQLRQEIREGAAKVGANAVILNPVTQSKSGIKVLGEAVGSKSATQKASGLAIYMPADQGRVTLACGR